MNLVALTVLSLASLLACTTVAAQTMDCSALDPRKSVSSQTEGKVAASATTLYKVAQAGGGIEGRIRSESTNLEIGAGASDKTIVKPRLIYLFCLTVANARDISSERRVDLFMQLQRAILEETATTPPPRTTAPIVRVQIINTLGRDQVEELVEVYSINGRIARLALKRGQQDTAFATLEVADNISLMYKLLGYTTILEKDGSTRIVSIVGAGSLLGEDGAAYRVQIEQKNTNQHTLSLVKR